MKYLRMRTSSTAADVWLEVACSECGQECAPEDNFCRKCGHRLASLPNRIDMDKTMDMLTKAARGGEDGSQDASPGGSEEGQRPACEDSCRKAKKPADSPLIAWIDKDKCPRGRHDSHHCEYLEADGTCRGGVYPTNPPQFDMCPLLGWGSREA